MGDKLEFPEGFLWGSATSAYQVEGGIENNDWAEAARRGKVPPAGRACDHYNRYEEDFDIAKSLAQNAHRFSIEWSRIEPEEGRFDETEIEHYRKVLKALWERGIEPFVTLWHFTLPVWFAKKGGFENKKAPFYFSRYCGYAVKKLGQGSGAPKFWITINEPSVYAYMGSLRGLWPPFHRQFIPRRLLYFPKVMNGLVASHNMAYKKIKASNPAFQVGIATNLTDFESGRNLFHRFWAKFMTWSLNHRFLLKIKKCQDFIGLNYYFHKRYGGENIYDKCERGFNIYPKGIYNLLIELKQYRKPVYVTENGIADAKDVKRAKFINEHLYWVKRAIDDKADVRGYFYWSLMDNFEWECGFGQRYGLVEVDYETIERRIRPSAFKYAKICKENRLEDESLKFL